MPRDWNKRYAEGDTPWDSGLPSRELVRTLAEQRVLPCRTLELGCGTGTNAVYLASEGFDVTAVDISPLAIHRAQERARASGVNVRFILADLREFRPERPFDFVFDRGCYHSVREELLAEYLQLVQQATRAGSRFLVLTGNANEPREHGPPALREEEIRRELGELFEVEWIREMRFQDAGGADGPLGWSCWLRRK